MKRNILITMGILILIGFAISGFFGAIGGIFIASIIGMIYGAVKHSKPFIKWSAAALAISIVCIILFYFCLVTSPM